MGYLKAIGGLFRNPATQLAKTEFKSFERIKTSATTLFFSTPKAVYLFL
jgi:hypothetical protein